jgi:hypothetical protein
VLVTIDDTKTATQNPNGTITYQPVIKNVQDYYSGGAPMPERKLNTTLQLLANGFNGKPYDNEVYGEGNFQDYGMQVYDPRLMRLNWSVDPLKEDYPSYTPYQFAGNKPIWAVDIDGLEDAKFDYAYSPQFIGGAGMGAKEKEIYQNAFDNIVWTGASALVSEFVGAKVFSWIGAKLFGAAAKSESKVLIQSASQTPVSVPKIAEKVALSTQKAQAVAEKATAKATSKVVETVGKSAYDIAASGGKHSGFLKNYLGRSSNEISKAIKSMQSGKEGITVHLDKMTNPTKYVPNWHSLRPTHQQNLLKGWQTTVTKHTEQIQILKKISGN